MRKCAARGGPFCLDVSACTPTFAFALLAVGGSAGIASLFFPPRWTGFEQAPLRGSFACSCSGPWRFGPHTTTTAAARNQTTQPAICICGPGRRRANCSTRHTCRSALERAAARRRYVRAFGARLPKHRSAVLTTSPQVRATTCFCGASTLALEVDAVTAGNSAPDG
jgi:hypothetical protein